MGQKASRDVEAPRAQEAPGAQEVPHAQDREEEAPRPRQNIRERCYQELTNGETSFVPLPEPRPPRPLSEVYARYSEGNGEQALGINIAAVERLRITGLAEDCRDPRNGMEAAEFMHRQIRVGTRRELICEDFGLEWDVVDWRARCHPTEVVTRATTLRALSQMQILGRRTLSINSSFLLSPASLHTIDMLGDYSDRDTGLERYLEAGCLSDEEKMAMRIAVFRGLMEIHDTDAERDARQKIIDVASANLDEGLEAMEAVVECWKAERAALIDKLNNDNPTPKKPRAKKSAKPAAKASKKTKKHSSRR